MTADMFCILYGAGAFITGTVVCSITQYNNTKNDTYWDSDEVAGCAVTTLLWPIFGCGMLMRIPGHILAKRAVRLKLQAEESKRILSTPMKKLIEEAEGRNS